MKSCAGMRWLNITFDWDMGNSDLLLADFGSAETLFTLPIPKLLQTTSPEAPTNEGLQPLTRTRVEVSKPLMAPKITRPLMETATLLVEIERADRAFVEAEEGKHR